MKRGNLQGQKCIITENNICEIQVQKQYMWNTNAKTIFVEYKYRNNICGIDKQKLYMWNTKTKQYMWNTNT